MSHCVQRSCDKGCPLTFACDTASNLCLRKNCTPAADCESMDFCVNGTCDEAVGVCSLPVP
ncbi:MAG: hypothetical protein AUK47_17285 [Deltaproteobacteria bacterium CG2_30_63_29]|nr:MAG: hypothetical protein AUK47_17285 [Deltaproteobacteria bacterium CG2_30_63_29]PIV98259.1 MAG: hypothetical protein COW42_15750 [Deltaproteobacteria bacterium CG17_big_fil_post_rev_8_21_14_2_50_63_7]PJB39654.1 MAG: hypothetical protein CO108_16805 [Deltaproteobacteria bacterium CG_4_9_14_3_um_filter_63_12]